MSTSGNLYLRPNLAWTSAPIDPEDGDLNGLLTYDYNKLTTTTMFQPQVCEAWLLPPLFMTLSQTRQQMTSTLERLTHLRHSVKDISHNIRLLERDLHDILYNSSDGASHASCPEPPLVLQPLKPPPLKHKRSCLVFVPVWIIVFINVASFWPTNFRMMEIKLLVIWGRASGWKRGRGQ